MHILKDTILLFKKKKAKARPYYIECVNLDKERKMPHFSVKYFEM